MTTKFTRENKGFTLVELMIVVVVFTILASFAIPSYMDNLRKSRRSDATIALNTLAAQQEKFFAFYRTYTTVIAGPGGCSDAACGLNQQDANSANDHYTLTATANGTSFTLTATAVGNQANDEQCKTFTLDNAGVRTATNAGGGDTTEACW
jgi:type IV pilus assembly protein PilE